MTDTFDNKSEMDGTGITEPLLQEAIGLKIGRRDVILTKIHVSSGSENVNNYASIGYFVTVTAKVGNVESVHTLFIKTVLQDTARKEATLVKTPVFLTEAKMYSELIPTMRKMQTDKCGFVFGPSVPEYYHSVVNNNTGIIILQNYRPDGYSMVNVQQGVDYEHCKLVMREIAVFHALSWAMKNENIDLLQKYPFLSKYIFNEGLGHQFLKQAVKSFFQLVKERSHDKRMEEAVAKLSSMDLEQTLKCRSQPLEPYAVICHGDFHVNNLLFKHQNSLANGHPENVKLIDLQLVYYGPPTLDLAVFFYSSTTRNTRTKYLKDLLHIYHAEFTNCLEKLNIGFEEFSFNVLEDLFVQSSLYGVLLACMYVPSLLCSSEDSNNFAQETEEEVEREMRDFMNCLPQLCDRFPLIQERLFENLIDLVEMGSL